jgi:lysyl endopeptidase
MKKIYLAVFLACSMSGAVQAQISEGGIPWSISSKSTVLNTQEISKIVLTEPDYSSLLRQDHIDGVQGASKPYRVATFVNTSIDLNNSGTFSYLEGGRKIWRAKVEVPNALGLDFFYDQFVLPKGVTLYLTNENKHQVIGGYTYKNNQEDRLFTNEPVQGSIVNLELDIDADVNLADIKLHIDKVGAYYRGVDDLKVYADDNAEEAKPTISPCHVNAICNPGPNYPHAMESVVKIFVVSSEGEGFCSGALINNTSGNCTPLMLTASHCDGDNSFDNAHFSQWKFRYRYETTACDNTTVRTDGDLLVGASFKARSFYPSIPSPVGGFGSKMVADFLLLQLNTIPDYAVLSGWNNDPSIGQPAQQEIYDFFIGFHHPGGDLKKLIVGGFVNPDGQFNQTEVNNTHWSMTATLGGMEPGSSGSPLFDKWGRIVGDLSGGTPATGDCAPISYSSLYSKISYAWNNQYDEDMNRPNFGPMYRLKDHLDPNNTGSTTSATVNKNCVPLSVSDLNQELDNGLSVYPNPSTGIANFKINLVKRSDIKIDIYNIAGAKVGSYTIGDARKGNFTVDMSHLTDGVYLLSISTENAKTTRKIVITR